MTIDTTKNNKFLFRRVEPVSSQMRSQRPLPLPPLINAIARLSPKYGYLEISIAIADRFDPLWPSQMGIGFGIFNALGDPGGWAALTFGLSGVMVVLATPPTCFLVGWFWLPTTLVAGFVATSCSSIVTHAVGRSRSPNSTQRTA